MVLIFSRKKIFMEVWRSIIIWLTKLPSNILMLDYGSAIMLAKQKIHSPKILRKLLKREVLESAMDLTSYREFSICHFANIFVLRNVPFLTYLWGILEIQENHQLLFFLVWAMQSVLTWETQVNLELKTPLLTLLSQLFLMIGH